MCLSSDTSFPFSVGVGGTDECGCADEEEHDERQGCAIVPHRIVDVLLDGGSEELDVVESQQFGDGEGGDGGHEYHQDAACHAGHGEGQYHLEELLPGRCAEVFRRLDVAAVHLLQGVVDGVDHERDEVVYHSEEQGSFAQGQVGEVEECHGGEGSHQDVDPHGQDEEHHHGGGVLHPGLREDVGGGVAQQDAEQRVEEGDADGVDEGVDGLGVRQELLEVVEREPAVFIGEGEHHDEHQGQHHEYRCEDGVGYRPALAGGE